jgi:tetratricopeptide (TPR) repeat protein
VNYSKAIEINPQDANAYFNRGNAYEEKSDHDRAIAEYSKVIEINPQDANAYFNRGSARLAAALARRYPAFF